MKEPALTRDQCSLDKAIETEEEREELGVTKYLQPPGVKLSHSAVVLLRRGKRGRGRMELFLQRTLMVFGCVSRLLVSQR